MSPAAISLLVADDERPARKFLLGLLKTLAGIEVVAEAASGEEAIALIETHRPQLALLDLHMPEIGGLDVVRRLSPATMPLVAFVTAFDDHAIEAFELNAIDYLLKPVQRERLQATLDRARDRMRRRETPGEQTAAIVTAAHAYERGTRRQYADRLPLRHRNKVAIVPVRQIASIVAEGQLLHVTTTSNETYTITHRLHALESRLDPRRFIRLSRGALANVDAISHVNPMPGGLYTAVLANGQELTVSRIQARTFRDKLLKL